MPDMRRRSRSEQHEATVDGLFAEPVPDNSVEVNNSTNPPTTVLGFDYGARRIGVAVGSGLTRSARALEVVANGSQGPDWPRLDLLLRRTSRAARAFAAALGERYRLPMHLVDERLSSREAARRFAERRARGETRRKHAQALDAIAAEIIVETWLSASGDGGIDSVAT
jgi:putative Holliday junction resolvase